MSLRDLWDLTTRKEKKIVITAKPNETISELQEKRALEIEERKIQNELNKLQVEQLKKAQRQKDFEDLKKNITEFDDDEEYDDDEEEPKSQEDAYLEMLLGPILSKVMPQNKEGGEVLSPPTIIQPPLSPTNKEFSDEEIRELIKANKKHLTLAKSMPKAFVRRKVLQSMPMSENEFERAYHILKTEF